MTIVRALDPGVFLICLLNWLTYLLGTANANEAIVVSLVGPATNADGLRTLGSFYPKFTYPIFGDDEAIFGYRKLKIDLRYCAWDMRPNLAISYSKKFPGQGETEAADIKEILHEFLPEGMLYKLRTCKKALN